MLNFNYILKLFSSSILLGNKPVFYFFIFLISFFGSTQQNLVPNGSFEEYWQCPQGNDLNDGQFERCKYWWKPTMSTPDYYNMCNTNTVSIPNNFWGYQNAFHGDAYVGFGAISWDSEGNSLGNEYFRTELLMPLRQCYLYKFTMYVSLAEVSTHGVRELGAWLTIENDFYPSMLGLNEAPQIINHNLPIIDTTEWTKIEGTFIANGLEKFLTIGYFRNNVNLDTTFLQDFGSGSEALYYADSITLIEVGPASFEECLSSSLVIPNVITPNNDGVNDIFEFQVYNCNSWKMEIINRWGNRVVSLDKTSLTWDGTGCTDGVYFYSLYSEDCGMLKQGFISLIR